MRTSGSALTFEKSFLWALPQIYLHRDFCSFLTPLLSPMVSGSGRLPFRVRSFPCFLTLQMMKLTPCVSFFFFSAFG